LPPKEERLRGLLITIGAATMTEDPIIIQMNIAHYRTMLKLVLDDDRRAAVKRMLAKANQDLALATFATTRH
jgi:hypothetical protein